MRTRSGPHSFAENLKRRKIALEDDLAHSPMGSARDALLLKIAEIDNVSQMDGWLRSDLHAPE